jgi:ankyrin repeat protein
MRGSTSPAAAGAALLAWLICGTASAADRPARLAQAVEQRDLVLAQKLLSQRVDVNERQGDGASALHWAVHWDDARMVDRLIRAGADVNAANVYGVTPLWLACMNANAQTAERLLDAGANANAALRAGETVLMRAARTGNPRIARALLAHGANVNARESVQQQTALMWAVAQGHGEVTRILLESGADPRARSTSGFSPLLFAARSGDIASARVLLDAGVDVNEGAPDGASPLLIAVASAQEDVARLLLERGANPNQADTLGYAPLHATVWKPSAKEGLVRAHASVALVDALLSRGADPDARMVKDPPAVPGSYFFQQGLVGATPYWLAAKSADVDIMRALAKGGASITLANKDGNTPLMVASGLGQASGPGSVPEKALFEAVRTAIELGGDVNSLNANGQTAAHGAAGAGFDAIIRLLAEHRAKLNVKDKRGQTPIAVARARNASETVSLLKSLGAEDASSPEASGSAAPKIPR